MSIITGRIATDELASIEAVFSDGIVKTTSYPDGYEYYLTCIKFKMDEETKDIVFSPHKDTLVGVISMSTLAEDEELDVDFVKIADCHKVLGTSVFALVDLLSEKKKTELMDLVYNTLASRQYTVDN